MTEKKVTNKIKYFKKQGLYRSSITIFAMLAELVLGSIIEKTVVLIKRFLQTNSL